MGLCPPLKLKPRAPFLLPGLTKIKDDIEFNPRWQCEMFLKLTSKSPSIIPQNLSYITLIWLWKEKIIYLGTSMFWASESQECSHLNDSLKWVWGRTQNNFPHFTRGTVNLRCRIMYNVSHQNYSDFFYFFISFFFFFTQIPIFSFTV